MSACVDFPKKETNTISYHLVLFYVSFDFQSTLDTSDKPNYRFSTTLLNRNYPGPNRVAYLDFKPFSPNIA